MTSPYTTQPVDAFMAAQTAVGLVLGAMLWLRPMRSRIATWLLLAAVALGVAALLVGEFLGGIGVALGPRELPRTLKIAAGLATASALVARRPFLVMVAGVGEIALWKLVDYIQDSPGEIAAIHLAFFGLLTGVHWRTVPSGTPDPGQSARESMSGAWVDDIIAFIVGTAAGCVSCRVLLHGWTNSGDEWANTFQAALFAKLRAYGSVPPCAEPFRSFWVFQYMGRTFSQYTPGWPLFMAPFVAVRAAWLAGPVSLGVLAAGVCRLGRRAAAGDDAGPQARWAGRFSVLALVPGCCVIINGGSRYPHVFVAAMFAWAVEALFAAATPGLSQRRQWSWGLILGVCSALMIAARPADGAMLGVGLFVYFVYAVVRRRVPWRAVASSALAFAALGALTLLILRLQIGKWLTTGYSLTSLFYPWATFQLSLPHANDYKWAIPLFTGAYCWFPCSPAVGLAGIAFLRGHARRMGFVFFLSYVPFFGFYLLLNLGRGFDLGYGPRYSLPSVVPMAVGTGVVLAALHAAGRSRWSGTSAFRSGGPLAVALTAMGTALVRIVPLLYPATYADVQNHNRLHEALKPLHLQNAVVLAGGGLTNTDAMDLPENLPLDLYKDQSVLIAIDRGPEADRCVRDLYPNRSFYRAVPGSPVRIVPY
jgi:hypothetical protein